MSLSFEELVKLVEEVSTNYQKSDRIKKHATKRLSTKGKKNKDGTPYSQDPPTARAKSAPPGAGFTMEELYKLIDEALEDERLKTEGTFGATWQPDEEDEEYEEIPGVGTFSPEDLLGDVDPRVISKMKKKTGESEPEGSATGSDANKLGADVNEIMLGYYALGGTWQGFQDAQAAKAAIEEARQAIGQEAFNRQAGQAKAQAVATLQWAEANGYTGDITKAWWTNEPGDIARATGLDVESAKNPADTLLQFSDGDLLGISAKSTKKLGDVGFKNPGMGTIISSLDLSDLQTLKDEKERDALASLGLPTDLSQAKLKELIRKDNDPPGCSKEGAKCKKSKLATEVDDLGYKMLIGLREILFKKLNSMDQKAIKNHLMDIWLDVGGRMPYYIKVTGAGEKPPYSTNVLDPANNPLALALTTQNISVVKLESRAGGADGVGIGVKVGEGKLLSVRFKWAGQKLASSMKLSGDPWGNDLSKFVAFPEDESELVGAAAVDDLP